MNESEMIWIDGRIDRSSWGVGEWDGEPDKVQWTDEMTGLVCLAKRHPKFGNWCGYVGVTAAHPWHGKSYSDCDVEAHGGLTFSDTCQEGPPEQTICHIPGPGEPDDLWWLGFDCYHAYDVAPATAALARLLRERDSEQLFPDMNDTYRTLDYVKRECAKIARQIAAVNRE